MHSQCMDFGVALLNDKDYVQLLHAECHDEPVSVTIKILQEWLKGNGRAVTWQILVEALRGCELLNLANKIEEDNIKGMPEDVAYN